MIAHVSQRRSTGCGIACLAMVAGVSYRKAVKAIFGNRKVKDHQVDVDQLAKALKKFGFESKESASFKGHTKAYACILGFFWDPGCPESDPEWPKSDGHFAVYNSQEDTFLDPAGIYYLERWELVSLWQRSGRETLVIYR